MAHLLQTDRFQTKYSQTKYSQIDERINSLGRTLFQPVVYGVAVLICGLALSLSAHAAAPPSDDKIQREMIGKEFYNVEGGKLYIRSDLSPAVVKTKLGNTVAAMRGQDSAIAQYAPAPEISGNAWRLTEVMLASGRFSASSTTFYSDGVRAKTFCDGGVAETTQCVTATRVFCEGFKKKARGQTPFAAFQGDAKKFVEVGQYCSQYADFLGQTLDPNKILNDSQRQKRDDDVLRFDLEAIRALKDDSPDSKLRSLKLKGLGDMWGRENAVGASSTGMKNRFDRLQSASGDIIALSSLATMCSVTEFGSADSDRRGENSDTPKDPLVDTRSKRTIK